MKARGIILSAAVAVLLPSCADKSGMSAELAGKINSDTRMDTVCERAGQLVKDGLNAGDGYAEVWIRDLNTFIELACEVSDRNNLKDALRKFFIFQGEDGNIDDGYMPAVPGMTGYDYKYSSFAPGFAAHKNTVETDQETSLVQAVYKYVRATGDTAFLAEEVCGKTVAERMGDALRFLLNERWVPEYGLLWGATTADWGDVQPEHPWGVALDESSHLCIDIYDQAMFLIAIDNYISMTRDGDEKEFWKAKDKEIRANVRRHLWDGRRGKYRPHIYLKDSPFPADLDEDAIHYHGGSAIAILAGLNTPDEVLAIYRQQETNRIAANARTIGLTVYPPYPEGTFQNKGLGPYSYQNGGDWTWFGARMVSALAGYGYYEEAYSALQPMLQRVIDHGGFFEWWTPEGEPKGSGMFRGSAGVLWSACRELRKAAAAKTSVSDDNVLWTIGSHDKSASEFALAPDRYKDFVGKDFGYEDKYYLIGHSKPETDFAYVLPGPVDTWGGTWPTAGWRTHFVNILFSLEKVSKTDTYRLAIDLADYSQNFLPLVKVSVNDFDAKFQLEADGRDISSQRKPGLMEPVTDTLSLTGDYVNATPYCIEIEVNGKYLKNGGNKICITVLEGSWIMFDRVALYGKGKLIRPSDVYVRNVEGAEYEIEKNGTRYQPLIVDVEHVEGSPSISVMLDGKRIYKTAIEKGRYQIEAPMPAVSSHQTSRYEIKCGGRSIAGGVVDREPQPLQTPADYVDTRIGTAHSRWMIAPGPWMPFSMVKMSPDNQNPGWQAGYQPSFETVGCFSHIHEWTLGGLGIMPANGELKIRPGDEQKPDEGYRSRIDKKSEKAGIGLYSVQLADYDIKAEVTATTRCGMERFTFPSGRGDGRILIDFHPWCENDFKIRKVSARLVSTNRIEGYVHQYAPRIWSDDADQDYTVNFVMEFDSPVKSMGSWCYDRISENVNGSAAVNCTDAGLIVNFDTKANPVIKVRSGISMVSVANASQNLEAELSGPFGWDFEAVVQNQKNTWNDIFNRVKISTDDRMEKMRFYNNMYRAMCSRNTWSDVNGEWKATDGKVRKVSDPDKDVMLGCDAFWNTFWNLNQFWNLVTPEWSSRWVGSQLAMYEADGWLAKGPAGLNYVPVMVAEHEIPLLVSAWQMGIRDFDAEKVLEACVKMQTTPARKVYNGFAGNRDLVSYMKYGYVPYDLGRFSNTMEYSFDDWTVGQLAKALGKDDVYKTFNDRGYWWKNVISEDGWCQMKDSKGEWFSDFDPFRSGANHHYVEGNAWQLTFFVPQDIPALVEHIGKDKFVERMLWGFNQDEAWRYNAPNDQYWDHPVVQGNQQSMHFAFLFNYAGKPWYTQKWSRSILERYYGCGETNAYLGDEDQGQMSAWAVMASLGLFQVDGGTAAAPVYEIASPLFEEVTIDLGNRYGRGDKFTIRAKNASRKNIYVQSAMLNGKKLDSFRFPASDLLEGGELVLEMGAAPDENWGLEK